MNKEDKLYKLSQGTYTAVWAHDEIRRQSKRIAELESMLVSRTKEVDDGITRYNKSVSKQQKIIAELENQWISVEDRLPAYGDSVLLVGNGVVQKVTYSLDGADDVPDWFEPYYFDSDVGCSIPWNKPTHWMPLPKPPKEQGE